jgi:hypothetical protein
MARWKLMTSHYLNVPNEIWEYAETDRTTGKPIRRQFQVPKLLDVNDPHCWTNQWGNRDNAEGEIIVCHEGKGESRDQVFVGDPTPDMIPLDDEAKAISGAFETIWKIKPERVAGEYSQSLVERFNIEMQEIRARPPEVPGLTDLIGAIKELVTSNNSPARRV